MWIAWRVGESVKGDIGGLLGRNRAGGEAVGGSLAL